MPTPTVPRRQLSPCLPVRIRAFLLTLPPPPVDSSPWSSPVRLATSLLFAPPQHSLAPRPTLRPPRYALPRLSRLPFLADHRTLRRLSRRCPPPSSASCCPPTFRGTRPRRRRCRILRQSARCRTWLPELRQTVTL